MALINWSLFFFLFLLLLYQNHAVLIGAPSELGSPSVHYITTCCGIEGAQTLQSCVSLRDHKDEDDDDDDEAIPVFSQ